MNSFPENEIKEVNRLLHKLLGTGITNIKGKSFIGEQILTERKNNKIYLIKETQTLKLLKKCSDELYLKIYKILNFYYPRWIAYNIIKESDDYYKEFSSSNELLLGLTSIIDWLANTKREKKGWTKRFIEFLEKNLSGKEIGKLIKNFYVKDENRDKKLKDLTEFAEYIYKIRSLVVHNAELGGMYPYNVSFDLDSRTNEVSNVIFMIKTEDFRKFLWRAIFNSLDLKIIY